MMIKAWVHFSHMIPILLECGWPLGGLLNPFIFYIILDFP